MINNLEDLWSQMQVEFERINGEFGKVYSKMDDEFGKVYSKMDNEFGKVYSKMDNEFGKVYNKMDDEFEKTNSKMDDGFHKINQKLTQIEDKLDIMTNTNLAQVLNTVTETKQEVKEIKEELIDKLDKHIEENELEHKKFDYKLAEMKLKYKYKK